MGSAFDRWQVVRISINVLSLALENNESRSIAVGFLSVVAAEVLALAAAVAAELAAVLARRVEVAAAPPVACGLGVGVDGAGVGLGRDLDRLLRGERLQG